MQPDFLNWLRELCIQGNRSQDFFDAFVQRLKKYPALMEEMDAYRQTGDFPARFEIEGYTVIDIMVWQIDHFKSHMDRGEYDMQENPSCMILMAYDTLLSMTENPRPYLDALQTETGTDYAGKY